MPTLTAADGSTYEALEWHEVAQAQQQLEGEEELTPDGFLEGAEEGDILAMLQKPSEDDFGAVFVCAAAGSSGRLHVFDEDGEPAPDNGPRPERKPKQASRWGDK